MTSPAQVAYECPKKDAIFSSAVVLDHWASQRKNSQGEVLTTREMCQVTKTSSLAKPNLPTLVCCWVILGDLSLNLQDMLRLALLQPLHATPMQLSIMVPFLQAIGMGKCPSWQVSSHPPCPDMGSRMGMGM